MKISPLDIKQCEFSRRLKGYDPYQVDSFLDQVAGEFEALIKENNFLRLELRRKEKELRGYINKDRILKETLITAQKMIESIKSQAGKEADQIISRAEIQAEDIVKGAQHRLVKLIDDINDIKRQRVQLESELRSRLEQHLKLLDVIKEGEEESEGVEEKLKVFRKG